MITDPTITLRQELKDALLVLEPQIRGIDDLALLPLSAELRQALALEHESRVRRQRLITAVLVAMDALAEAIKNLDADGYPLLPIREISGQLITELNHDHADIHSAIGLFKPDNPATEIKVILGDTAEKPEKGL